MMKKAAVELMTRFGYKVKAEKLCTSIMLANDGETFIYKIEAVDESKTIVVAVYDNLDDYAKAYSDYVGEFVRKQIEILAEQTRHKKSPESESDFRGILIGE